jgi:hypothetical protein
MRLALSNTAKSVSQIRIKVCLIATLVGIFVFHPSAIAISCDEWFKKLNLKLDSLTCEADCTKAADKAADANKEFYCTPYCRGMCVPDKDYVSCKIDPFWTLKLNSETKPFSRLQGNDLRAIKIALSKMPKSFRPKSLKAIVKASGPGDISSLSSPASSSDEYLILFPKGFLNPDQMPRIILHELSHFMLEREWKSKFSKYKEFSGWNSLSGRQAYRSGDFVDPDGRFSADEDFSNNIEFYLFEPEILKEKSPSLYSWIKANLGKFLLLEKGCRNAN